MREATEVPTIPLDLIETRMALRIDLFPLLSLLFTSKPLHLLCNKNLFFFKTVAMWIHVRGMLSVTYLFLGSDSVGDVTVLEHYLVAGGRARVHVRSRF